MPNRQAEHNGALKPGGPKDSLGALPTEHGPVEILGKPSETGIVRLTLDYDFVPS